MDSLEIDADTFNALKAGKIEINGTYYYTTKKIAKALSKDGKYEIEFVNGEKLAIVEDTYNAIAASGDFVSLNGVLYNRSVVKQADKIEVQGEGGGESGTPFAVGDTLSKVYFDTSKSKEEVEAILTNLLSGDNGYLNVVGGEEDSSIATQQRSGVKSIVISDGDNDPQYVFTSAPIEGEVETAGWQLDILDNDGAYTFTSSEQISSIDIDYDGESVGKADLWNGVWVSSTEFAGGSSVSYKYIARMDNGNQFEISEAEYAALEEDAPPTPSGESNPYIAQTDEDMADYLKSDFVGKFVKFTGTSSTYVDNAYYQIGEQQQGGETVYVSNRCWVAPTPPSTPLTPLVSGTAYTDIKFNVELETSEVVDYLEALDWENAEEMEGMKYVLLLAKTSDTTSSLSVLVANMSNVLLIMRSGAFIFSEETGWADSSEIWDKDTGVLDVSGDSGGLQANIIESTLNGTLFGQND